ncbi:MIP/aquaporin family protein [Robertkochia aurantiaca]|uniref:MIP/aquaporin family protein n=1 Tax=Robertkochia aurantiaca TaxID=2873700 RepID=UPI001CC9FC95|nr:MIP/aquaporin family protein [Robertkochia sp. 3YJGBD-33]
MTPVIAEFLGTFFLILLGNGVVANVILKDTKGNNGGWIVITTGWALAVFTGVVVAAPYSGAHINPAVTVGLALTGQFPWLEVPVFILAQMAGAMAGSFFVWLVYRDHYHRTNNNLVKLATFATIPAIRKTGSNLISEAVGTFTLLFVIFYFTEPVMNGETVTPIGLGSLGALPVALLVWVIGLSLGGTTGYAINPARDLGPRIMHAILPLRGKGTSDWKYAWIPVAGPLIGAAVAAGIFLILS